MKNTRKLIPAIAMLLLSAVLMSTASFAWFSTNTTATANGMVVKVASATNILISKAQGGTYKSTEAFTQEIDNLVPASAVPAKAPNFFYMEAAGNKMIADSSEYGTDSEFAAATAGTQYIAFTSYLKVVGETIPETIVPAIALTIEKEGVATPITTADSPVYAAFRVLIVYGDTALLYAPVAGADATYSPIASVEAKKPTLATTAVSSYSKSGEDAIITNVEAETPYQVDVYVWLEGQDSNCKAANAISLKDIDIAIMFNLVDSDG